jgi:hypothetical protein
MEPRARVVEAAAARFNRVAEASLAALELEEAARLVTAEGPFRRPLKVRVERKHDLASIMGKLDRRCWMCRDRM